MKKVPKGKHAAFASLVEEKFPELSDHYNQLQDISWTARYNDYEYERAISNLAMQRLKIIKAQCQ